ncbi:hypothetical protein GIB67_042014 [Kingdonia uniflora]|uniref:DUF4283 domain-containing protein n=1 Tax=Kingdonia uniflora TaxID=39325 RepID=A0A7J7NZS6_9MAGN|nr:hypothetical protein GIB67_042014 [Kingdonia uniflora]
MRITPWNPNFSIDKHNNTNALIWYKFQGFPMELWSHKIVMSLGKTLGTPIHLDHSTMNKVCGYNACVLVDIDLSKSIPKKVLIEVEGEIINQEVILHMIPKYCGHCSNIGHIIAECKVIQRACRQNEQLQKISPNPVIHNKNQAVKFKDVQPLKKGINEQQPHMPNKHVYFQDTPNERNEASPIIHFPKINTKQQVEKFREADIWSTPKAGHTKHRPATLDNSSTASINPFQALSNNENEPRQ